MLWYFNKNEKARDEIIFGEYEPDKYMGGIRRFDNLPVEKLKELADLEYIDIDDHHNAAPTAEKFIGFMEKHPGYTAMGYVVSVKRDDYRMNVDGIEKDGGTVSEEEQDEFEKLFGKADDFKMTDETMYAWFD